MINFDLEKISLQFLLKNMGETVCMLRAHPEVKFVSFAGVDLGGHLRI